MIKDDIFTKEMFGDPRWVAMIENKNDLHGRSFSTTDLKRAIYKMLENSDTGNELGESALRDLKRVLWQESHEKLLEIYNDFYKQLYNHDECEVFLNFIWGVVEELRERDARITKMVKAAP